VITAVDSNILIDALTADQDFGPRSREALAEASSMGAVVVSEIVYTEISGQFPSLEHIDTYLSRTGLQLVSSSTEALHSAGQAWVSYVRSRQEGIACMACGRRNQPACEGCRKLLRGRQHLVADFLIGAHASVHADRLLTRDRGYYSKYFPTLTIIDPSAES
jgi:predicted nucleic acid-binding protein